MGIKGLNVVLAAFVALSLFGCTTTGSPIRTERVKSIIPGKTTSSDLSGLFGTPTVLEAQSTDTSFALFPEKNDYDMIYFYRYAFSYRYPIFLVVYMGEFGKTKTDRLWVLVNEKTGTVEDYAFKQYERDTIFGRSPMNSATKNDGVESSPAK